MAEQHPESSKENQRIAAGLFIPAGLFIGMGIGWAMGNFLPGIIYNI